MSGLVSIVLPVYNGEKYLAESIESVVQQTYQNWELIIVDDCSTDSTPTIAKEYASKDPRIRYYRNKQNQKLPQSLNVGFSHSKGYYLTWTSDDNKYRPNAIEYLVSALKESSSEFVFTAYARIDEDGNWIDDKVFDQNVVKRLPVRNVVGPSFMYTRPVYEKIGEYDRELFLAEDFDYWQRIYGHFGAVYKKDIIYDYRMHGGTLTNTLRQADLYRSLSKTITKNRYLFGRFNIEQNNFYYETLSKAKELANEPNIYKRKYQYYATLYFLFYVAPSSLKRKLGKGKKSN